MNKNRLIRSALCMVLAFAMTFAPIFSSYAMIANATGNGEAQATEQQDQTVNDEATTEETASGEEVTAEEPKTETEDEAKLVEEATPKDEAEQAAPSEGQDTGTVDDEEGEAAKPADTDTEEEVEKATKTEYVWKDTKVKVTATLSDAEAIPDDAKLVATAINKDSTEYNYEAYMDALNKDSESKYDESNTMLYDIAFIKDGVELQPEAGKVSVTFDFLDDQLKESIGAKKAADVNVIHLPLVDDVKAQYDTTAAATDIEATDINVEEVTKEDNDLKVSVRKEKIVFETESFSTFAYTTADAAADGSVTVNITFKDSNGNVVTSASIPQNKYFVYVNGKAQRSDGQQPNSFVLRPLSSSASATISSLGENGNAVGPMIDGESYTINIYQLKDGKTPRNEYASGEPDQNDYSRIGGDTFIQAGSKTYQLSIPDTVVLSNGAINLEATEAEDPNAVHYGDNTDKISIVNINSVLGRAVEYGILAEKYTQTAHTETNWAVNTYDRVGDVVTDPDLGTNTEDVMDTGYPFIMTEMTNGFRIGSTSYGTMAVYTSNEYAGDPGLFRSDSENVTIKKYFRDRATVKADVDAMIDKITDESDALYTKTTVTVPDAAIPSNNFTLDITSYADDDVVYVNVPAGSKLEEIISTTADNESAGKGGLTIRKKANQMVVFNFESTGTVNINKIAVEVDGKRITSDTINQVLDNEHNKDVDTYIIRKIIWNANKASQLNIDMGAGMFLVPRGNAHCQNASAGWIASGGNVTANGEWHFAFRQRQFATDGSIKFEGRKELRVYKDDGTYTRLPIQANDFKFTLYKTDETYDTTSESATVVQEHLGNTATSAVQFQDLNIKDTDLTETDADGHSTKTFYYVVREELPNGTVPELHSEQTVDGIDYWTGALKIKIVATLIPAAEGSGGEDEIQFIVSSLKTDSHGNEIGKNDNIVATTQVFTFGALPNATSDQKVRLMAKKNLVGKTWRDDIEFEFKLTPLEATDADGNTIPVADIPVPSSDIANASNVHQTAVFGAIEFAAPGVYKYQIQEQAPEGAIPAAENHAVYNNIDYDLTPHTATVTVTQDGDKLKTDVKYDDTNNDLTVTNTAITGGLNVNKHVISNAQADKDQYFRFRVVLSDTSINGTYGEMEFVDGVSEFSILGDHHKYARGLPVGITYTVTEEPTEGYTTTSVGASGTIAVIAPTADFHNTSVGSLKVTKVWDGLEDSEIAQLTDAQKAALTFVVKDSDQKVVKQFTYADFTDSEYIVENLPVGNYTVVESGADTLDTNGKHFVETIYSVVNGGPVAVSHNATSEMTVTNKYDEDKGSLTVTKTWTGDHAKLTPAQKNAVSFEVTGPNGYKNTFTYADMMPEGSKTLSGLSLGEYTVTETNTSVEKFDITTTYKVGDETTGTVELTSDGDSKTVDVTNDVREHKGSLTVTKTWTGDHAKLTAAQKNAVSFEVTGPNDYKATFTYEDMPEGFKTLSDLPLGNYTVEEKNASVDGFAISTSYKVGETATATAEIASDGDSKTVEVTNNVTELKGNLVLTKSWAGDTSELTDDYKNAIEFTVTGPNNYRESINFSEFTDNTYVLTNLTPGTYKVTESNTDLGGYEVTTTYKVGNEETATIELTSDGGTVNVTNDYNKLEGELTVKKTWTGDHAILTEDQKKAVTFTVEGPEGFEDQTFTYADMPSGSKTLQHLPLGEYTVTESNASYDGFTVATTYSVGAEGKVAIADGDSKTVTVTNDVTQLKGKLTLTKSWTGDTDGLTDNYKNAIKFTVTGPNNYSTEISYSAFTGDSYEIDDLTPGQYTVVETNETLDGYVVTKTYEVGDDKTGTIDLTHNGGTVNVTNDYNKLEGELTVKKTWTGDHAILTDDQKKAVTFTVEGPEGFEAQSFTYADMTDGSKKLEHLPLGEYTVTETNATYKGFTVTTTYSVGEGKVTIADGDSKTVTVTNAVRQDKGSLTVTKTWAGDDAKLSPSDKNKVSFKVTGPNAYENTFTYGDMDKGSKTLVDLPLGEYTVTETNSSVDGFTISTVYKVDGAETGTAEISSHGDSKTVEVTNNVTQLKGQLVLTKTWTGDTADLTDDYKKAIVFTVTGPDNYSKTIEFSEFKNNSYELAELTPGQYKVVESNTDLGGYEVTTTYKVGKDTTDTIELTMNGGEVNVTNNYNKQEGELTVKKTWTGDHAKLTADQKKAVTFTVAGPTGFETQTFTYADMTGDSKTLQHLPLGEYTVTETNASYDGYTVDTTFKVGAQSTNKATLADGDSKTVEVTNAVTENKGSINLKKNVTVNGEAVTADDYRLVDGDYEFNIYKVEGDKETKVNTDPVKLTIKDGKSETTVVSDLDAGSYVVEEIVPENPKHQFRIMGGSSRQNVTVTPSGIGTVPTAEFTNNYARTSIELEGTKTLQNGEIASCAPFEFSLYDKAEYEKSQKTAVSTATSAPTGEFQFSPIEYTLDDLKVEGNPVNERVFEYVAVENVPEGDGIVKVIVDGEERYYDKQNDILYDPSEKAVKVKVTYDPQTGKMTAVTEPATIDLNFVNKKMYTKLSLTKSIDQFIGEDTEGELVDATIVFSVSFTDPITYLDSKGDPIVGKTERSISVKFDKDHVEPITKTINQIPIDLEVDDITIKEVYSSNYSPGKVTLTKAKDKDGYPVWKASCDNTQVRTTTGSGIINNVGKENGNYVWKVDDGHGDQPVPVPPDSPK